MLVIHLKRDKKKTKKYYKINKKNLPYGKNLQDWNSKNWLEKNLNYRNRFSE